MKPPTEIPYKEWAMTEAEKYGVNESSIYSRVARGMYPDLKAMYLGTRTKLILSPFPDPVFQPKRVRQVYKKRIIPGAIKMKEWIAQEMDRTSLTEHAIEMRLWRGKYPNLERLPAGAARKLWVKIL